jgi:catechol O-methyltransferase
MANPAPSQNVPTPPLKDSMLTDSQTKDDSNIPSFSRDDRSDRLLAMINGDKAKYENNPTAIIQAIRDFTRQGKDRENFFPIYSPEKIAISRGALSKLTTCKLIVEMGVCVGTSAIGWGQMVKDFNPGDSTVHVYALELDEKMCKVATELVKLSGLADVVTVIQGTADSSVEKLVSEGKIKQGGIDALFLDHWKDRYLPDLQLCEDLKLFREGSLILADNTDFPGAPDYVAYVRSGGREGKIKYETRTESTEGGGNGPRDVMITEVKAVL